MLELAWPLVLLALPLPWLVFRYLLPASGQRSGLRVPFFNQISGLGSSRQRRTDPLRLLMMCLAWVLLVLACARPQWIGEAVEIPVTGRDLMLAVDISGSMKARDMANTRTGLTESRLDTVKRVAGEFIERREGDRLGLILFGTNAYLHAPLSFDRTTIRTLLDESVIGIAGEKTAIGDAIALAVKRMRVEDEDSPGEQVLVLLTDGANTAGRIAPLRAADLARQTALRIHTIGIGAPPAVATNIFGQPVVSGRSELDEKTLDEISRLTDGRYFRATDEASLAEIYDIIDELEPAGDESRMLRPFTPLFHYPLLAAMLLVAGFCLGALPWLPGRRPATASGAAPLSRS